MRTSFCLGAALVALLLVWQPAVADEKPRDSSLTLQSYESEHYRLQTDIDKSSAEEYLRVLEAAWPQYPTSAPSMGGGGSESLRAGQAATR